MVTLFIRNIREIFMRLFNEADDIPKKLLDAIENDDLVVFAGAGVSIPEPSKLPNFKQLALDISKNTPLKINEEEHIDRFLGKIADLYNNPYYVHNQVFERLRLVSKPNYMHEYILKLFKRKIRIVTTNFDNLFSISAKENNIQLNEYCAPALPLGDNFEGLVYLHGNIYDRIENLVVTDKDFAQAYICRGWATRFLQELFEKYTVLFIGYSYNDTILNYLTRGIVSNNLFAFVPDERSGDWDNLGIHAIKYIKDETHTNLKLLLEKIIETCCNDVLSETTKIEILAAKTPNTLDGINIEYIKSRILNKDWMCEHFFKHIPEENREEWLIFLFENNHLKPIFTYKINVDLDNTTKYICQWIVDNFLENEKYYKDDYLGDKDGIITKILKKYDYNLSDYMVNCLNRKFLQNIKDPNIYAMWLEGILKSNIANIHKSTFLTNQLCICIKENYITQAKLLLHHLLKTSYNYRKKGIEHNAENYWLKDLYRNNSDKIFDYYQTLLSIIPAELEKSNLFLNNIGTKDQISFFSIRDIENCGTDPDDVNYDNDLMDLVILLRNSFDKLIENKKIEIAKSYVCQWLNSELYLLNRVGIYGLYSNEILNANDTLDIFINKNWLCDGLNFKHEVRHYFKLNYNLLSDDYKEKLYKNLVKELNSNSETYKWVEIMRFLRYVLSNPKNQCDILNKHFSEVVSHIDVPLEQISTDLDSYWSSSGIGGVVNFKWQYPVDKLIKMDLNNDKNIELLLNAQGKEYVEDVEWGESREGVLIKVKEATINSYQWGLDLLEKLLSAAKNCDLYSAIFNGLGELQYNESNFVDIIQKIILFGNKVNFAKSSENTMYSYLYLINKITKVDISILKDFEYINTLKSILEKLWHSLPEQENSLHNDILNQSINNIFGEIIVCIINIMNIEYKFNNQNITVFDNYKKFFEEEIFNQKSFKSNMGLSILSSRIPYFYFFSSEWTKKNLIEKISNKDYYQIVWNSFAYSSPKFTKDFILDLLPQFNNIINNKQHYNEMIHLERFYDFYLLMFLYTLLFYTENLGHFNLDRAIDNFDTNGINHFYNFLSLRLKDENLVKNWDKIDNWIWDFWANRLNHTTIEEEKSASLDLIFSLDKYFVKCVEIIKTVTFSNFNEFILYRLREKGLAEEYPNELVSLLNHIINKENINCIQYHGSELKEIIEKIIGMNIKSEELKELLEKLVNNNFEWAILLLKSLNT